MGESEYVFKHALTQEVAYNSVLMERRQQVHERIAAAIETLYTSSIEEDLAALAHHYGRSANLDKAVQYLTRAGQQALSHSAFAEAPAQLQQGLEWIKKLPESPERNARELELASTLAQVLLITKGFTALETRAAVERARDLAEKGGNLAQLVIQVLGIWRSVWFSGDYSTAVLLADRILEIAEREGSPASLGCACYAQASVCFFRGDLVEVEQHFARWGSFAVAADYRQVPGTAVAAIGVASFCAAVLGRTDSERERIARAIAFTHDSNNPYDLAVARTLESWLFYLLREPQRAKVAATQALVIVEEHAFPLVGNLSRTQLSAVRAQCGSVREGIALIRQGLAGFAESGNRLYVTDRLTGLAEAQTLDGKIDDALVTIEEALQSSQQELVFRPNALTLRGALRLRLGHTALAVRRFLDARAERAAGRATAKRPEGLVCCPLTTRRHTSARELHLWVNETEHFPPRPLKKVGGREGKICGAGELSG